jgi:transcriptional regulator with XRE-family HTH domain
MDIVREELGGITVRELAARAGINHGTVRNMRSGNWAGIDTLRKLATVSRSVDWWAAGVFPESDPVPDTAAQTTIKGPPAPGAYPNREIAAAFAERCGYDLRAIRAVLDLPPYALHRSRARSLV